MRSATRNEDHNEEDLDARKPPPEHLKSIFKKSRKYEAKDTHLDPMLWDEEIEDRNIEGIFKEFLHSVHWDLALEGHAYGQARVHKSKVVPGLVLLRNFLPAEVQKALVLRLLGRDLKNPQHQTNLHLHYNITYPRDEQTFLDLDKQGVAFKAKLPVHRDLTMDEVFRRKLRWILLGGQYDWTEKRYRDEAPPTFPPDIRDLVRGIFPSIEPEAAIINVYSPGDTLSLHRDVSEKVNKPLVSISIGCDALLIVGNDERDAFHIVPMQSGDVVYMADEARYAWHGVPRIIAGTCPEYLQSLPQLGHWKTFMEDKRINLNIRQMF